MGISHEYHSAPRRARRGTVSGKLRFLGAVVAILLVSYAITAILEKGAEGADDTPSTNASGIAYSQAQFTIDRPLTSEEQILINRLSEQVKQYSRRVGFDTEEPAEAGPLVDPETGEIVEPLQ